jgi:hypothetical protein
MSPTGEATTREAGRAERRPWLILIHQIPPKPDYLRVKIGRHLQRVGAAPIKNSVYALPAGEQAMEDLQWIRREIVDGGGDASICRAAFIDGLSDAEVRQIFVDLRSRDYEAVEGEARALLQARRARSGSRPAAPGRPADDPARLRRRLTALSAIDFFGTPARRAATEAVDQLAAARRTPNEETMSHASRTVIPRDLNGRTWVTRRRIFVDRIASAWLIARFIDPAARFKFVVPEGYQPAPGELRFDMFDAEFTHEGDRCTFETLLARRVLDDPALATIGEIVHDIDLKDAKFERDEASGIKRILTGIAASCPTDEERLARGRQLFDDLYAALAPAATDSDGA